MPSGIPVGTLAIGKAGAANAGLLAAAILGTKHPEIREAVRRFRAAQTAKVLANPNPAAGGVLLRPEQREAAPARSAKQIQRSRTTRGMARSKSNKRDLVLRATRLHAGARGLSARVALQVSGPFAGSARRTHCASRHGAI